MLASGNNDGLSDYVLSLCIRDQTLPPTSLQPRSSEKLRQSCLLLQRRYLCRTRSQAVARI